MVRLRHVLIGLALIATTALAGCLTLEDVGRAVQGTADGSETADAETDPSDENGDPSGDGAGSTSSASLEVLQVDTGIEDGTYELRGVLENRGSANATELWVTIEFLDAEGETVNEVKASTPRSVVPAGEQTPFTAQIARNANEIEDYEISVDAETTQEGPPGGEYLSASGVDVREEGGQTWIRGEVVGSGDRPVDPGKVIVVLLDAQGRLLSTKTFVPHPTPQSPDEGVAFQLSFPVTRDEFAEKRIWVEESTSGGEIPYKTSEVEGEPNLSVVEAHGWRGSEGRYHVTGIMANRGTANAMSAETLTTFYDGEGHVVDVRGGRIDDQGASLLGRVPVNETSPFTVTAHDRGGEIEAFDVDVMSTVESEPPRPADVSISDVSSERTDGTYRIQGSGTNEGSRPLYWVGIVAAYENDAGELVGADRITPWTSGLQPGESGSFTLETDTGDRQIVDHRLWVGADPAAVEMS